MRELMEQSKNVLSKHGQGQYSTDKYCEGPYSATAAEAAAVALS